MSEENNETKELNVEDILEDLSYSWATPEAQDFHYKVVNKKFESAKKMLEKEGLTKEEINLVMKHFKNKYSAKKKLTEYFSFEWESLKEGEEVLVSYGGSLFYSRLYENFRSKDKSLVFYAHTESVELSKAIQLWKVEVIEE